MARVWVRRGRRWGQGLFARPLFDVVGRGASDFGLGGGFYGVAEHDVALLEEDVGVHGWFTDDFACAVFEAFMAASVPRAVSEEMTTTGIGRCAMILRRKVSPSILGISMSRVMTSGPPFGSF